MLVYPRYCIKIHRLQLPIAIADDNHIVKIDGHGSQLCRCASGTEEALQCADDLDYGTRATGNFMRQPAKVIIARSPMICSVTGDWQNRQECIASPTLRLTRYGFTSGARVWHFVG